MGKHDSNSTSLNAELNHDKVGLIAINRLNFKIAFKYLKIVLCT